MKNDTLIARVPKCRCIVGISALRIDGEREWDRRNNLATIAEWLAAGLELETTTTEAGRAAIAEQFGCDHDKNHLHKESPLQLMLAAMKTMDHLYDRDLEFVIDDCIESVAEYEDRVDRELNDSKRILLAGLD